MRRGSRGPTQGEIPDEHDDEGEKEDINEEGSAEKKEKTFMTGMAYLISRLEIQHTTTYLHGGVCTPEKDAVQECSSLGTRPREDVL